MENELQFLHEQVYIDLKEKILGEVYKPGEMLPKEMTLMDIYQVSRHTIRKAMDRLFLEGYIYKVKGTGTFVKSVRADYKLSNMTSFSEIITNQEGQPNSIVIEARKVVPNDKVKAQLELSQQEECYYIERIRRNGKTNLCFEKTYINQAVCPNIIDYVTPNTSLFKLYEEKYNLKMTEGNYNLEAITSSSEISKILDIKENSAILYMEATIYLVNNTPLYYVEAYYIGSRYIFSTQLKRS